jgi:hypothetical protein
MIIRGQKITVHALSIADTNKVYDSFMALKACDPPERMLHPDNHRHLLAVIAQAVRQQLPDVTFDEIDEALDMASIGPVLLALSGQTPAYNHQETAHVQ